VLNIGWIRAGHIWHSETFFPQQVVGLVPISLLILILVAKSGPSVVRGDLELILARPLTVGIGVVDVEVF